MELGNSSEFLGPFQTSNFTCAESNANEKNLLFSLICIGFGTCKVRRLKRALGLSKWDLKENLVFAEVNKNLPELAGGKPLAL